MRRLMEAGIQGRRLLGQVDVAVMVSVLALVAQVGLGLSPWVRTTFTCFQPLCSYFTTAHICSTLTNISVFSIGPFINAVCILSGISLWRYLGLLQILHGIILGRNENVRLWEFSPLMVLIIILMPCSLSYVGWLFMYVQRKWTSNFLDPIQVLHLWTSLVLALQTTVVGLYFVGAFSLPAVLRDTMQLHRNHFRTHIVMLRTLNIALISYCISVLVLLGSEDDVAEKQDAIRMAFAEILYRVACVVAASMLKNACEVVLGNPNQLAVSPPADNDQSSCDEEFEDAPPPVNADSSPHKLEEEIENVLPPANDDPTPHELEEEFEYALLPANENQNPHELDEFSPPIFHGTNPHDPPPAPPHLLNDYRVPHVIHYEEQFVTQPNYRMEGDQPLNRESSVYPFQSPGGDFPRTVVAMETNPKCGPNELVTLQSSYKHVLS